MPTFTTTTKTYAASGFSSPRTFTSSPVNAAPSAPTGLSATPGTSQISLSWNVAAGGTSQQILRGTSSGTETVLQTINDGTTNTFIDAGLSAGTTYFYEVRALNVSGTGDASSEVNALPIPAAPTSLNAVGSIAQVVLTWTAAIGAVTYNLYRGTSTGAESGTAIATGVASTTYTDTGRAANTAYYYTVKAVNGSGLSPASTEANATTTIQTLTATISPSLKPGDTNKTITLIDNGYSSWTAGTPGSPIFTVSKSPTNDVVKNSQVVSNLHHGSMNIDAGVTDGTLTITDPVSGKIAHLNVSLNTRQGKNSFSIGLSI